MARRPEELLHLLSRAERLSVRRVQSVLDGYGCSVEAWRVLDLLSDGHGHHMTALAEHAFLAAPSLTKLIDQLVDQNLVFRRVDPVDRRRVLAHLTERGRQRWQLLAHEVRAGWTGTEPPLDDEDDRQLGMLLDRLARALEEGGGAEGRGGISAGRAERAAGRGR
ncbi:putative MarR-family regulator [Streptomyces scabiei 87.22]|uniref:Putative MarR-family regulator n=1 Tax=Streptomyces scabiei (strain 87.22) TaxID=680198 RepID=C9Z004_STRSW|nr:MULTISPECIES: MarR family transcriptional regulator [Streptomyces]MBP5865639.1 MarR family transcriptional regulator [Streptomyces sp. LBUM 1484]MBP5872416.1 MarR family transcriptional regulator [Streptomyces sp. LBUM 1485]MBP5933709.1 MarR family transcriptional regulator [Streptomyces sp. LBUM 1479]KFG04349.1 MarR family transcriptional regulator [Streptomyces scabiei]MBP5873647.1 MarR family transcriptional regulator [Streptomyces sp. LBUM 1477]